MIEVALLLGLGAVGYMLAVQPEQKESFVGLAPRAMTSHSDEVPVVQEHKGHNNEVPFFGARVTQSMYSGATNGILDSHTGAGKEYFQKRETQYLGDIKPGVGNPFGNQVETDFMQERMVSANRMNNVFPIDQVRVAPGANDGYTNLGKGGFQQDQLREYSLPKTTDETRVVTNPKVSYSADPVPGVAVVTQPGLQAPVNKNKPDRFVLTGMDRVNTAVGAQTAPTMYAEQLLKEQARETTSVDYKGSAGGNAIFASYIRAFTEPFQEFMRLTAEGRPNAGSAPSGTGVSIGVDHYSAQTKKDETVLSDATRFNVPAQIINGSTEHLGSYRFNEPLKQDVNVSRNEAGILDAFKQNPYTQTLGAF